MLSGFKSVPLSQEVFDAKHIKVVIGSLRWSHGLWTSAAPSSKACHDLVHGVRRFTMLRRGAFIGHPVDILP